MARTCGIWSVQSTIPEHLSKLTRFENAIRTCCAALFTIMLVSGCAREKAVLRPWSSDDIGSVSSKFQSTSFKQSETRRIGSEPTLENVEQFLVSAKLSERQTGTAPAWNYRELAIISDIALRTSIDEQSKTRLSEIHRIAVRKCLKLTGADQSNNTWELAEKIAGAGLELRLADTDWAGLTFTRLVPCSDYEIRNIEPIVKRDGWGLPILADRIYTEDELRPEREKFFADNNRITATARIRILPEFNGENFDWKTVPAIIELHNPLDEMTVLTASRVELPLAADFTTPSLVQFSQSGLQALEYEGLLLPDLIEVKSQIYINEPYRPGKIPVVFVHGLWSSPRTWTDMNNSLLNDPEIRANYQFFFALYPTGETVLESTSILREKILELRQVFDPDKSDHAWDQMVVVCHSMGGIISRLLITESNNTFENAVFTKPLDQLELSHETRESFRKRLHFKPVPEIKRVVFLAPVFRGSSIASRPIGRISSLMIRSADDVQKARPELLRNNGLKVIQPDFRRLGLTNGIDSLQPANPMLKALDKTHPDPSKPFHIILGDNQKLIPKLRGKITDGLVTYESGHLEGAQSELVVAANHYLNHDAIVIEEVRRILRLHIGLPQLSESGPFLNQIAVRNNGMESVRKPD